VGGSGYLAAFVMGLMVGNMRELGFRQYEEHEEMLENFVGQVSEIATLLIFVTLGMNLPFDALRQYLLGSLLVMAVFIFVARPATVLACLLPDRRGGWTREELAFLSWSRYTGVIPAAAGEQQARPRRRGRGDRGLPGRLRRGRHTRLASHDRGLRGAAARPPRGTRRSVAIELPETPLWRSPQSDPFLEVHRT
jgi:Sodium/hydrogen exchanger family